MKSRLFFELTRNRRGALWLWSTTRMYKSLRSTPTSSWQSGTGTPCWCWKPKPHGQKTQRSWGGGTHMGWAGRWLPRRSNSGSNFCHGEGFCSGKELMSISRFALQVLWLVSSPRWLPASFETGSLFNLPYLANCPGASCFGSYFCILCRFSSSVFPLLSGNSLLNGNWKDQQSSSSLFPLFNSF